MNKLYLFSGVVAGVALCGCYKTEIAGVKPSEEQLRWQEVFRRNYPDYQPPRYAAPADSNNKLDRVSDLPGREMGTPVTERVPATVDDSEVTTREITPAPQPEVKPEATPAPQPEVKPEATPAPQPEVKPEVKPAPQPEVKPEVKPAPQPEVKPAVNANEPPDPTSSTVYVVKRGDTLGHLSVKYYGHVRYMNILHKANSDKIKDPNKLQPGMQLIIPKL